MKKIVTIGGGTGSFVLLTGLKKYPFEISAIVSMVDDGGSTGILRDELGVLPPGDVRQCLVALSQSSSELRKIMNYRFEEGRLKGHSFGNLFLSALEKINGDFASGVLDASRILNIQGEVLPVTNRDARLIIELKNGEKLVGQNQLDHNELVRKIGIRRARLMTRVNAYGESLSRIGKADYIIIGPGDLYGSILPNLMVKGVGTAIKNSKAKVILNCNLTNKKGQTEGFYLEDYVEKINDYISRNRIDFVIFNNKAVPEDLIRKYEKREGKNSIVKERGDNGKKYKIIKADLLYRYKIEKNEKDSIAAQRSFIRHDPHKLADTIAKIIKKFSSYGC